MHTTDGLQIDEKLSATEGFGTAWTATDQRLGPDCTTRRIVRELSEESCGAAWKSVRDRVARLRSAALPFVVPIREAVEADGTLRIVCDAPRSTLADELKPDKAFADAATVRGVARSLLRGLEALHGAGLAHGDLRPTTIHLSHAHDGARRTAWLADAATGGMACWTQSRIFVDESRAYWPPESVRSGHAPEPKPRHDFHALGLLLCEMLAGTQANPLRKGMPVDASVLDQALRDHGTPRALRQGILRLLQADEHAAARDFLPDFQEPRTGRGHARDAVLPAAVIALAIGGLFWTWRGWNDAERRAEAAAREKDKSIESLQETIRLVEAEVAKLKGEKPKSPAAVQVARAEWNRLVEKFSKDPPCCDDVKSANEWFEALKKSPPATWGDLKEEEKAEVKNRLGAGIGRLRAVWNEGGKVTIGSVAFTRRESLQIDEKSRSLYVAFRLDPWNEDGERKLVDRLEGVEAAWKRWNDWTDFSTKTTYADVREEIAVLKEGGEKDVLREWFDRFPQHKSIKARLVPRSGSAPPGWGTTRQIVVAGVEGEVHAWGSETAHAYPAGMGEIEFDWEPGSAIDVALWGERRVVKGGRRAHLLGKDFCGPFSLWRLMQRGGVAEDGFELTFDIEGCPGPPRVVSRACP